MANITIWDGSCTFDPSANPTPFGFYDTDAAFQVDACKVANFCAKKLGYPMMDVELQSGSFYAAFEEAVTTYGTEVYQQIASDNFGSLQGGTAAKAVNATLIRPSLSTTIRTSQQYGMEAGVGGFVTLHTGSLHLTSSVQDYDLNQWSADQGITGSIEVRRVFYEAPPAIVRFFDPYAGTGAGIQSMMDAFDFGSFSPAINFMLMPASYDLMKIQAIEFNDQIRKSAYSFEIHNNQLKIFPIPKRTGILRFEFYKNSEKQYQDDSLNVKASASSGGTVGGAAAANNVITNLSNVPTENPIYSEINSIGRQWIFKFAAAAAKETLGYVRGKYTQVPIPGSETTLNQADLLADARSEKTALVTELKALLQTASLTSQLSLQATQTQYINDALKGVPMTIYIG